MFALTSHSFYYIIYLLVIKLIWVFHHVITCIFIPGEQNCLLIAMQQPLCEMDLNYIFTLLFGNSSISSTLILGTSFLIVF